MLDPSQYSPDRSFGAKIKRRLTYWQAAQPMPRTPAQGIVSFTFDDFPKSAAQYGSDVLARHEALGTYYACTGMREQTNIMGEMYGEDDLQQLTTIGHDIGLHTQSHLDCARVNSATVRDEIEQNITGLNPTPFISHFAWPYGETTLKNKSGIGDLVSTARGILPGINRKGSDLMQLSAFELTPDDKTTERAASAIEQTARKSGWTIIFTHDVRPEPSPFGTTPDALERLVKLSKDAGLHVLPISNAFSHIQPDTVAA
ncbi:MAG: polysaccharide deacetylase family protein [Pseudomonadota bacterium]